MSPIEQKLQKCGPCGGIPPYPRFIQEKLEAELLGKPDRTRMPRRTRMVKRTRRERMVRTPRARRSGSREEPSTA